MIGVYIFCAIVGIPLQLLFAFGGGDVEGEVGFDADLDAGVDISGGGGDIDVSGADAGVGGFFKLGLEGDAVSRAGEHVADVEVHGAVSVKVTPVGGHTG